MQLAHRDEGGTHRPQLCGETLGPAVLTPGPPYSQSQTVGSTLKPTLPPWGRPRCHRFPTSLHLQGNWLLESASRLDSRLDHTPSQATLADPGNPNCQSQQETKNPASYPTARSGTSHSPVVLSLALLKPNTEKQMASHRPGFQPLPPPAGPAAGPAGCIGLGPGHTGPDARGFAPRDALPAHGGCWP